MKEQILKKSELNIKNMYDYGRITRHHEQLISCSLQEKDEDIIFQFDMDGLKELSCIRKEKEENKLLLLMDIMQFDSLMEDYQIELAPANLFYDANYKVKALMRDVYPDGKEPDRDDNLKKEKAICAYVLQTRYSYEDYYEGDSWRSKFINGKMGKVSESFENVSAYNEKIVVYAIYEEGNLKIIIRDIYNKDEVYKEIIDEFPNIAVGSYIIKDARVINNHLVYLNYYLGNDWKMRKKIYIL